MEFLLRCAHPRSKCYSSIEYLLWPTFGLRFMAQFSELNSYAWVLHGISKKNLNLIYCLDLTLKCKIINRNDFNQWLESSKFFEIKIRTRFDLRWQRSLKRVSVFSWSTWLTMISVSRLSLWVWTLSSWEKATRSRRVFWTPIIQIRISECSLSEMIFSNGTRFSSIRIKLLKSWLFESKNDFSILARSTWLWNLSCARRTSISSKSDISFVHSVFSTPWRNPFTISAKKQRTLFLSSDKYF